MHTVKLNIPDNIYEHVMFLLRSLNLKKIEVLDNQNINNNSKYDILKKSAGILSTQNIDPLKWQEEIRSEWDEREELFSRLQHNHLSSK